jgi:hypothetical protein
VKHTNLFFVIGLVLAVGGAALLVFGIVGYNDAKASVINAIGKVLSGRSRAETTAIAEMVGGGGAALIGLVLMFARGRGKAR